MGSIYVDGAVKERERVNAFVGEWHDGLLISLLWFRLKSGRDLLLYERPQYT